MKSPTLIYMSFASIFPARNVFFRLVKILSIVCIFLFPVANHKEAEQYKNNCIGFDIIGLDYECDYPWLVHGTIKNEYERLEKIYDDIYIIANSIGAYYTMNTLKNCEIKRALFISPIVDMEKLITDMMVRSNVTEEVLQEKGEISTEFGETLSWEYLNYVRNNPIEWDTETEILYAGNDNLTSMDTIKKFVDNHSCGLTVMKNGEHWFHTEEQLSFLNNWMKNVI